MRAVDALPIGVVDHVVVVFDDAHDVMELYINGAATLRPRMLTQRRLDG